MEKLTLEAAINEISQAFATIQVAKEECNDVINSALDAYFGEIEEVQSKKQFKAIKAARKTEIRNIKKLAKAMMKGEKAGVAEETANMDELLQAIGG